MLAWDTVDVIRSFDADWAPATRGPNLSVAFLRWTLGIDKEPVGLDPAVAEAFPKARLTLETEGVG